MLARFTGLMLILLGFQGPSLSFAADPTRALLGGGVTGAAVPAAKLARVGDLSSLERRLLERALKESGHEIEHFPFGKVIAERPVITLDVFGPDDLFPEWLNLLRFKSREAVITSKLIFKSGESYDEEKIQRARRNITDPGLFSVVLVVPVVSETPGAVDVLTITKDLWSLRANSNFQITGDTLDFLAASISENNFLGFNVLVAISMLLEPDHFSIGPNYVDDGVFGTGMRITTLVRFATHIDTGDFEGAAGFVEVAYPVRTLAQQWIASVAVEFEDIIERRFRAGELRRFPIEPEDGEATLPWSYRNQYVNGRAVGSLILGDRIKHLVTGGWGVLFRNGERVGSSDAPAALAARFEAEILPRSEVSSFPVLGYRTYDTRFRSYRNMQLLNLTEDFRMGHDVIFEMRYGHPYLGSDRSFLRLIGIARYRAQLFGDDLLDLYAEVGSTQERGTWLDTLLSAELRYATPVLAVLRIHMSALLEMRLDDPSNRLVVLGGDAALRGFPSSALIGTGRLRFNLELRSLPIELWTLSLGFVAFYDVGDAFDARFEGLRLKHGFGIGLRIGIPQVNRVALRFDWGLPVSASRVFPGLLSFGFEQAF